VIILIADYIYRDGTFIQNEAVAFDTHIRAVGAPVELSARFPEAEIVRAPAHSVIYPGFVNAHVHLEFSSNKTSLHYGEFIPWLFSVIEHRDALVAECDEAVMENACREMLESGVTTFGAVSSFGADLEVCAAVAQRVIYFNELIGSSAQTADVLYGDFLQRVEASEGYASERFIPAVAVHAPYSVHPVVLSRGIALAKRKKMPLSTHFLESPAEREWLERASGPFAEFFKRFFNTETPVTDIETFMHAFDGTPSLFVHGVQATDEELGKLKEAGHTPVHCPRSNRYLGCGRLRIEALESLRLPYALATDGLSSNDSLSILDEMRAALMLHHDMPLQVFAKRLIDAVTRIPAEALGLDAGVVDEGKAADLAVLTLPEMPLRSDEIALWSILHAKKASMVFIEGERYV
jgi:cytosine/adenosine deaminase-related metal-dependent hydrolase